MILESTSFKGLAVPIIGAAGTVTGIVEILMGQTSILGPVNLGIGGVLLALWWFGNRIAKVAEKFLEQQGEIHLALPARVEKLEGASGQLLDKLEHFATSFDKETAVTQSFREELIRKLENHTVRIEHLEKGERRD